MPVRGIDARNAKATRARVRAMCATRRLRAGPPRLLRSALHIARIDGRSFTLARSFLRACRVVKVEKSDWDMESGALSARWNITHITLYAILYLLM